MPFPSHNGSESPGRLGLDSQYEFIDNDSLDHEASQSIASTDYVGAEDVTSLDDTDESEDDELENNRDLDIHHSTVYRSPAHAQPKSPIPSFNGLDGDTETPTITQSKSSNPESFVDVDSSIIEFHEPAGPHYEAFDAGHITYEELIEKQSFRCIAQFKWIDLVTKATYAHQKKDIMQSIPETEVTLRQTMCPQSLSTKESLRILYVGCDSAKHDIIHKIASSVAASPSKAAHSANIFNVLPISNFGSSKCPDVELMHSSQLQITVDTVARAFQHQLDDEDTLVKLIMEDNSTTYESIIGNNCHRLAKPDWNEPHVAIIYSTENDSVSQIETRNACAKFMDAQSIPIVAISHELMFHDSGACWNVERSGDLHIRILEWDIDSVFHDCPIPVDLETFARIDAQQLNRHLACITGLYDQPTVVPPTTIGQKSSNSHSQLDGHSFNLIRGDWRRLLGLVLAGAFLMIPQLFFSQGYFSTTLIKINGNVTRHDVRHIKRCLAETVFTTANLGVTTASTAAALSTTTKTSEYAVGKYFPQYAGGGSGVAQDKFSKTDQPATQSFMNRDSSVPMINAARVANTSQLNCIAGPEDRSEMLIKLPQSTVTSWFLQGPMSLNITRAGLPVQTERTYLTTEGIILKFPRRDAHGVMTVIVHASKRLGAEQTCTADLGSSWRHDAEHRLSRFVDVTRHMTNMSLPLQRLCEGMQSGWKVKSTVEKQIEKSRVASSSFCHRIKHIDHMFKTAVQKQVKQSQELLASNTRHSYNRLEKQIAQRLYKLKKVVSVDLAVTGKYLDHKMKDLKSKNILLDARIESKIAYLHALSKVTGNDRPYREYKRKAERATGHVATVFKTGNKRQWFK